jgi:hypothetical protein
MAGVDGVLHFGISGGAGEWVVDTDETRLPEKSRQIQELREYLAGLWPPHQLSDSERDRIVATVTSIVGVPSPDRWPTIRAVISGDVITFSIEVDPKTYDSYRLTGEYHSPFFPPPTPEARAASSERLQYGAVKLRSAACPSEDTLRRAAAYGADILRRRGESLADNDRLRLERLGDNNHLVLFVRNSLTGENSWLAVTSNGAQGLIIKHDVQRHQTVQSQPLNEASIPSPWLAPPKSPKGEPACSYPLFIGGEQGSRLVEIWLVMNQRTDGAFALAQPPTPLYHVQYLFLPPR